MRRQIVITTRTFHHHNLVVVRLLPVVVVVVMVAMWQEVIPSARRDHNIFVHGFHLNTGSITQRQRRQRRHDLRTTSFTRRLRRSAPHLYDDHHHHHHQQHDNHDLDPNNESSLSSSSSIFPTHPRRTILRRMVGLSTLVAPTLLLLLPSALSPPPANAFANKISKQYDDRPKRRGPKPPDLGIRPRTDNAGEDYIGLKPCNYAPNCFSSTIPSNDDDPDHSIPPWVYPKEKTLAMAMEDLYQVILHYPPGQANIDGGGFDIQTYDPKNGYLYVQFESLKNGYIDDFEAAYVTPSTTDTTGSDNSNHNHNQHQTIQIRSSSRVGYLDYGVNAKRINYIARELKSPTYGWIAADGVPEATHRRYFIENEVK